MERGMERGAARAEAVAIDADRGAAARARLGEIAIGVALAWFALETAFLGLRKSFSIDEFQYAHAAWLVAHGSVPYRDFFEVHFPLVYQALAPVFAILGFLALACFGAAGINRREGRVDSLLAPLFLLALPPFVTLAIEIRPDAAACALFLAALGALRAARLGDRAAGFASGAFLVAAVWSSQKAAFYGSIFAIALVSDVLRRLRRKSAGASALLRSPLFFCLGALSVAGAVALYLTVTRSWAAWWSWCFVWAAAHERGYPGFSWRRYFDPIALDALWALGLGGLGLATTVRRLTDGRRALSDPDLLLVAAVPSTLASFALQRAPYPYSLLPFLAVAAVLAARGAALLLAAASAVQRVSAAVLLACVLGLQSAAIARFVASSNAHQLAVLGRVAELTAPSDAAYDNSGGYVSRPHAFFYFYTDSYLRESIPEKLARDVPRAILANGAVLSLVDLRFDSLPDDLRAFVARHFQPVDGDIALWGQHYVVPDGGRLADTFLAVRSDRYFVAPPEALGDGTLRIDGEPVTGPGLSLAAGTHALAYDGPARELDVLWLPRNGERWTPRRGLAATFSRLF